MLAALPPRGDILEAHVPRAAADAEVLGFPFAVGGARCGEARRWLRLRIGRTRGGQERVAAGAVQLRARGRVARHAFDTPGLSNVFDLEDHVMRDGSIATRARELFMPPDATGLAVAVDGGQRHGHRAITERTAHAECERAQVSSTIVMNCFIRPSIIKLRSVI